MRSTNKTLNRRQFFRTTAGLLAAPAIIPATALGRDGNAPNNRIQVGVIGLGARGFNLLGSFLAERDAVVVAVCDVDKLHYRDNRWGEGTAYGRKGAAERVRDFYTRREDPGAAAALDVYSDYRELCRRDDIDAVVIATPDHWHALCTLEALKHGKDIYCEKPVTHFFREGQAVYREVAKQQAVFQAGSQQRSDGRFQRVVELAMNGLLGKIQRIEVGLNEGYAKPMGDPTVTDPPGHLDYDFWCGPAPVLPYMRARHHRWWRGHRAYGGGVLMDWIGHHNDIAHWALGLDHSGPVKVEAAEWTFPETEVYNTPQDYTIRCEYEAGISSTISSRNRGGVKLIGEDGWVYARRGALEASEETWTQRSFNPGPKKACDSSHHVRNFLECIRTRKPCVAPAETAHRSITPGHLGYVSNSLGRPIAWDPAAEKPVDDPEAEQLLNAVDYRAPWAFGAA